MISRIFEFAYFFDPVLYYEKYFISFNIPCFTGLLCAELLSFFIASLFFKYQSYDSVRASVLLYFGRQFSSEIALDISKTKGL